MSDIERPSIKFGTDGWRGIIADDFTGENVRLVSRAVVNYFLRPDVPGEPIVFIGYDNRSQSEYFAAEAAAVVAASGLTAILSDRSCSSPAVSYNAFKGGAKGGIMITASHNPPQFNGLKIKMGYGGSALPSVIADIEVELDRLIDAGTTRVTVGAADRAKVIIQDLRPAYFEGLASHVDIRQIGDAHYSAVADCMHGSGSGYLDTILRDSGTTVSEIRNNRNPVFGGINPEPIEQNLAALNEAVLATRADVGLAIDGDADRVGAMDSQGRIVDSHRIFALVLRHLYEDKGLRGSVVKTVSTTTLIDKLCRKYGLTLHVVPIGFKNICEWMLKEPVLIGGEESGGIGVMGYIPERDGPMMSLQLLETMAARGKNLDVQIDELMAEFGEHEYQRVDLRPTPSKMTGIIERLRKENPTELAGTKVEHIDRTDGTKFLFANDAWLLLRASGTEPVVRVYAEAGSRTDVQKLIDAGVAHVNQD